MTVPSCPSSVVRRPAKNGLALSSVVCHPSSVVRPKEPAMRIDAYTHFFPPRFFAWMLERAGDYKDMGKRVRGVPALHDLDHRKKIVDMFPDYAQVLSYPQPPLETLAKPSEVDELAFMINDGLAEICAKDRDHFPAFVAQT